MTPCTDQTALNASPGRTTATAWLVLANLMSLGSTLVITIVLSRHMSQADYGTYRQVIYVYTTLLTVFSLGLPKAYAYFLARAPLAEGRGIVRRLTSMFTALAAVFSVTLFAGAGAISEALGNPSLTGCLKLFSVTPMLLMPVLGVESILTVYGMTRLVVAYVVVGRTFSIVCAIVPVVTFKAGALGAVAGFVASSVIVGIAGLWLSTAPFRGIRSSATHLTVSQILRFSLPVFYSGLYGFVIGSAGQFFISRYLGVEDFALYANGYRELPIAGVIISAVCSVMLPEFSRMSRSNADTSRYVELWQRIVARSSSMIYPFSVFCFIFAREIMGLLYGPDYHEAAVLFQIVVAVNLTRIVPYAPLMFALGCGREFARAHLITAILIVSADALCVSLFPSLTAIAAISAACTVVCIFMLQSSISRMLHTPLNCLMPWSYMLKTLAASATTCIIARCVATLPACPTDATVIALGLIIGIPLYFVVSRRLGITYAFLIEALHLTLRRTNPRPTPQQQ